MTVPSTARHRTAAAKTRCDDRIAGIYVRISSDPSGQRLGVTRQLEDCQAKAAQRGWTVAGVYEDNDVTASTGRRRPAYERLLRDIEAGRINAVVVWDLDRLTRRPIELENFIALADKHGVPLASIGGDVDLSTDNGRMVARIKGAVARAEVDRKSARHRRANLQRAERGVPGSGARPYGYEVDRVTVVESEATEIRKAAEALLAGATLHGIVRDLNARGVGTSRGGRWAPPALRRLLRNPRYAGLLVYQGEIMGEGAQPAILDMDTFRSVVAILDDPARQKPGPPRRYLLSGLATCATCGGSLYGTNDVRRGYPLYRCQSRDHLSVRVEPIDDVVLRWVGARLATPEGRKLCASPDRGEEAAALRNKELTLRGRLDGLAQAFAAGDIDASQLRAGSRRLRAELDEVTEALASLSRDPVVTGLVSADDIGAELRRLAAEEVDTLRAVLGALVIVTVTPPGRGGRSDHRCVDVQWRAG